MGQEAETAANLVILPLRAELTEAAAGVLALRRPVPGDPGPLHRDVGAPGRQKLPLNFVEIRVEAVASEAVLIKHSVSVLGPLLDKCLGRADKSVQSGVPVSQEDLREKDEVTRLTAGLTVLSVGSPA